MKTLVGVRAYKNKCKKSQEEVDIFILPPPLEGYWQS